MIDNSHTFNENVVSVIISYKNGLKQKSEYKKYNLKINKRKADVEYINQATTRYFSNNNNPIPNLFIVDGSKAQVNEVKSIFKTLNLNINVIGLVKNKKHITKSLINIEGKEITIEDKTLLNFFKIYTRRSR